MTETMKERKHPAELQSCIGRTVNWSSCCHEKDGLVWHNWKQKDMRQPSVVTSVFIYWLVPWSNEAKTKPTETPYCIFAPHQIDDLGLQFPHKVEKTKSLIFHTMQGRFTWKLRCIAPPLKWNMRKENAWLLKMWTMSWITVRPNKQPHVQRYWPAGTVDTQLCLSSDIRFSSVPLPA
jgi:hypothetical protein